MSILNSPTRRRPVSMHRIGNTSAMAAHAASPPVPPTPRNEVYTGEWFCSKCFKKWPMRGMHPDCDAEARDMSAVVVTLNP